MKATYELDAPDAHPDGPGKAYAEYAVPPIIYSKQLYFNAKRTLNLLELALLCSRVLHGLSVSHPSAFICHFYNFYLAHTAGGVMIGKKVLLLVRTSVYCSQIVYLLFC